MSSSEEARAQSRDQRLKRALKDNLQKRKAQAKARADGAARETSPDATGRKGREPERDG